MLLSVHARVSTFSMLPVSVLLATGRYSMHSVVRVAMSGPHPSQSPPTPSVQFARPSKAACTKHSPGKLILDSHAGDPSRLLLSIRKTNFGW